MGCCPRAARSSRSRSPPTSWPSGSTQALATDGDLDAQRSGSNAPGSARPHGGCRQAPPRAPARGGRGARARRRTRSCSRPRSSTRTPSFARGAPAWPSGCCASPIATVGSSRSATTSPPASPGSPRRRSPGRACRSGSATRGGCTGRSPSAAGGRGRRSRSAPELLGDGSLEADVEIVRLTIELIRAAGLGDFQVNLGPRRRARAGAGRAGGTAARARCAGGSTGRTGAGSLARSPGARATPRRCSTCPS